MTRLMLMMLTVLVARLGHAQDFEIDTREALDIIKKWNFASNALSESTFREIYADRLTYYTKTLSENECIALKKAAFKVNPSYKQKIISDPAFKPFTSGVVKADFVKEVFENGRWRKYNAYLIISYEKNRYSIIGESDTETDKKYNYKLSIGRPMDIPQSPIVKANPSVRAEPSLETKVDTSSDPFLFRESLRNDTAPAATVDSSLASDQILVAKPEDSTLIESVTEEVLSDETVAVPKKYVYLLIGLLALTAVIIVVSRKPKRSSTRIAKGSANGRETSLVRNDKSFENFVVALFDPHYFTIKRFTREPVYAGNAKRPEFIPSLEFEFQSKDSRARLAIECIFIPKLASREILAYSSKQINRYHDFEEGSGTEVYLIIGLEGDPSDPKELFLIPASELREGYMGYRELQPFKKHGMFFYNSARRRLL